MFQIDNVGAAKFDIDLLESAFHRWSPYSRNKLFRYCPLYSEVPSSFPTLSRNRYFRDFRPTKTETDLLKPSLLRTRSSSQLALFRHCPLYAEAPRSFPILSRKGHFRDFRRPKFKSFSSSHPFSPRAHIDSLHYSDGFLTIPKLLDSYLDLRQIPILKISRPAREENNFHATISPPYILSFTI